MSWGSRPSVDNDDAFKAVEKKKDMLYRNYRSQFLIFWASVNGIVGYGLVWLYSNNEGTIILYIGAFLMLVMFFRITFAVMHMIKAKCDKHTVKQFMKLRKSTIFKDVEKHVKVDSEDVFRVYYDNAGNSALIKKDDPRYKKSVVESSIKAQNVFRGFSLVEINKKHQISQGGLSNNNRLSVNPTGHTHMIDKFFQDDEESSGLEEIEEDSDS